jgi:hypothetical protein
MLSSPLFDPAYTFHPARFGEWTSIRDSENAWHLELIWRPTVEETSNSPIVYQPFSATIGRGDAASGTSLLRPAL